MGRRSGYKILFAGFLSPAYRFLAFLHIADICFYPPYKRAVPAQRLSGHGA